MVENDAQLIRRILSDDDETLTKSMSWGVTFGKVRHIRPSQQLKSTIPQPTVGPKSRTCGLEDRDIQLKS